MAVIRIHFDNLTLWALMELKDVAETATGSPMPKTHNLRLALAWLTARGERIACESFWEDAISPMNCGTPYKSQYLQGGNLGRIVEGIAERTGICNEKLGHYYRALKAGELPEGSRHDQQARSYLVERMRSNRQEMANLPKR
jgi:hypothetical protein